ncbi:MAG: MFS transporter [Ruminococcaceae bacterium]|nr:MFS transporter [Oscillospiraceae bacterium]
MALKKTDPNYKWVILVICFLMEFLCLGFCSSNQGLFTKPITSALGIDRLAYSYWSSIRYAAQVLVALSFGTMVSRFGFRTMVFAGLSAMIGATLLRAFGSTLAAFYLAGALHGAGIVFVGGTMAGTIVRRWFKQDIGKYTGIVMAANGIGGAAAAQIVTPLIDSGAFGFRKAFLLSAIVTLVIGVFIILFLRDNPNDGPMATGKQKKQPKNALWVGMEYTAVKKRPYFYLAAFLVFLTGISLQSIGSITIVYLSDLGFSSGFLAATATVSSLVLTCSKLITGTTYDKWGLRAALLLCQFAGLSTFILNGSLTGPNTIGMVFAMTATILSSTALPLETVMIPLLTNDLFGSASYNKVLGIFMAMNSLGLCLGSPLGEWIRNLSGTYRPCFWIFGSIMIVVIVAFQFVIRSAYKDRDAILSLEETKTV